MEFFAPFFAFFTACFDIVFNIDTHLTSLVQQYGPWIYAILFLIIFAETGFVVTPFLPGDSLLFVAGALTITGEMNLPVLMITLVIAAVLGNQINYFIGLYLGPKVFQWEGSRFFNRESLLKTHRFYEKHGGKTIIISRFLPIFRTFAPFVAGIGTMNWLLFAIYNVIGALSWVVLLTSAGYLFGNIPWVKKNLSLMIILIIIISLIPVVIGLWKSRRSEANSNVS